jgi:poly(3-hydroxyalkanoate) synthetase
VVTGRGGLCDTGADQAHLLGTCSGGIVSALVAGHLATIGRDRLASFTLLVTNNDLAGRTRPRTTPWSGTPTPHG